MTELPWRGRQSGGRAAERPDVRGRAAGELVAVPLRAVPPAVAAAQPAAEHHLGDRLAAFVDGELGHDARERVQAHLATCAGCRDEAEAQRRVKELLSAGPEPAPSGLLTARLLAIAAESDDPGGPWSAARQGGARGFGGGALDGGSFGRGSALFGAGALGAERPLAGVDPRAEGGRGGFGRGRRFAFVAAGAFSVAAVALSGALTVGADTTVVEPYGSSSPIAETTPVVGGGVEAPLVRGGFPQNGPLAAALDSAPEPSRSPTPTALPDALPRGR